MKLKLLLIGGAIAYKLISKGLEAKGRSYGNAALTPYADRALGQTPRRRDWRRTFPHGL